MIGLYKKILCPVDFSPYSAIALKQAVKILQICEAKLVLGHIITNPLAAQYKTEDKEPMTLADVDELVKKKIEDFADIHAPNIDFEIFVAIHEHTYKGLIEYASLVEYASDEQVDLIVLSTHGYVGSQNQFLGSVAERVVRQAPCSVLVVRDSSI